MVPDLSIAACGYCVGSSDNYIVVMSKYEGLVKLGCRSVIEDLAVLISVDNYAAVLEDREHLVFCCILLE